jgi:uncharacterized membrane protein YraQ (UPF0718 family)
MLGIMHDTVMSLSNNRFLRDLFWHLDRAGPWLLAGLLLLLLIAGWRRTALLALAFSALCGLAMAVALHVNYVMPIWRNHESAIRYLDSSAAQAGFAAGAFVSLLMAVAQRVIRAPRRKQV